MDSCLELGEILLKVFAVPKALGANAAKGQILSRAHLNIAAALAGERFAAADAILQKHNLILHDGADFVDNLLNIVVAFNREQHCVPIVI